MQVQLNWMWCSSVGWECNSKGQECCSIGRECSSIGWECNSIGLECSSKGWECSSIGWECTVGWSDFHFFSIIKNGHIAIACLYFYKFISKKSTNFAVRARQNFHFQKVTETLKMNIFLKLPEIFLLYKRTIVKNRIQNQNLFGIFLFSKMTKTVFNLRNSKKMFFKFLFVFSFEIK